MKKIIVLSLALVMALAFASCGGGGDEVSAEKSKTFALFQDAHENDQLYMKVKMEYEGEEVSAEFAIDGENSYIASEGDMGEFIMITKEGKTWILDPATKTGTVIEGEEDTFTVSDLGIDWDSSEAYEDEKVQTGTVEVNGETYDYEQFSDEEGSSDVVKFVYDGKKLVYIISEEEKNDEIVQEIVEVFAFESKVDSSFFDVPEGYDLVEF